MDNIVVKIENKDLKKIEKLLNKTISSLLYGGAGDPGWAECEGAAVCFKTLKLLNLKIEDEENTRIQLETENVCKENFLKNE